MSGIGYNNSVSGYPVIARYEAGSAFLNPNFSVRNKILGINACGGYDNYNGYRGSAGYAGWPENTGFGDYTSYRTDSYNYNPNGNGYPYFYNTPRPVTFPPFCIN